jgi:catechol 2,3-dioxygenase-like lactoylglutathione lyase family enzyme
MHGFGAVARAFPYSKEIGFHMIEGVRMRFDHVSIAVRSIDRAYEFFKRYFPVHFRNEKRRDDQVSGSFHWQDFWLGGFAIEMIEDLPGQKTFVSKFIDRRGEGMHHLSIEVDHLKPLTDAMKHDGVRIVDEQTFPDGSATAFISPRSAFGTLIQFWQVPHFDNPKLPPASDGLARFDHVSIAVRDIKKAYDFFMRYFPATVSHEPHLASEGFILGHLDIAGFKLEFVQSPGPGAKNDFVGRFIEKYGEGLHHMTINLKNFESTLRELKSGGVRVVDENRNWRGEGEFYISPKSAFGTLIQIWDAV